MLIAVERAGTNPYGLPLAITSTCAAFDQPAKRTLNVAWPVASESVEIEWFVQLTVVPGFCTSMTRTLVMAGLKSSTTTPPLFGFPVAERVTTSKLGRVTENGEP